MHRRQLVLGPEPVEVAPGWQAEALGNGLWLSHCPALPVRAVSDAGGRRWVVCGIAVEVDPARPDPASAVRSSPTAGVLRSTWGWAGRWLLVSGSEVHPDASGLLGCFVGADAEGRPWLSTSPALLADRCALTAPPPGDHRPLTHARGISWRPPPRSGLDGVRKVLPSQTVDPSTGRVDARAWLPPIDPTDDLDRVGRALEANLGGTLRGIAEERGAPWLGLTAGYDSRLVLAIATAWGVPVRLYTRLTPRMSVADRLLPPRIAASAGREHVYIRPARRRPDRWPIVERHALGHVAVGDAEPLLAGVRDELVGVTLGGHGFALAGGFGGLGRLPDVSGDPLADAGRAAMALGEPPASSAVDALAEWFRWVADAPIPHLRWQDRFFLEQRQAGWLSAKEQVYDLGAVERLPLLNAAVNHALLLGLRPELRHGSTLQEQMLGRIAGDLLEIPINPSDRSFGVARALAIRAVTDPRGTLRRLRRAVRH